MDPIPLTANLGAIFANPEETWSPQQYIEGVAS